jgi:DNA-binding transcriptional regulator YiaG
MSPAQFKEARHRLGLSAAQLAHILNTDPRTIRKWEADETTNSARDPNPVAARVVQWMLDGYRPPEWPCSPR